MPERIILIGADEPGLNAVLQYQQSHPETQATVLYPELNPLSEFSCVTLEKYLGREMDFPERLRAFGIDRDAKKVLIRDNISGRESTMSYDKLVFASGAAPADLDVSGEHFAGVLRIGDYVDAERLAPVEGKTIVVGSGLNLLLTVSAIMQQDIGSVEIIYHNVREGAESFSENMAGMIRHQLQSAGVKIHDGETLQSITKDSSGLIVKTDKQEIPATRVINASNRSAVSYMAEAAGIELDNDGAIIVDAALKTNDTSIFACGSCASFKSSAINKPIPGSIIRATEGRQAQMLTLSLGGEAVNFIPPVCAFSVDLGDLAVAGSGMTVAAAREYGYEAMSAIAIQFDRAHFMPETELMTLELVFDATTRQVLGIQGLGKSGDGLRGRVSAVSVMLGNKPTIDDISNLELAYSPPFASAMDVINTVANIADNMLLGINEGIDVAEFKRIWAERETNEHFFLDCRELGNAQPFIDEHPLHWNHIPQGELCRRMSEIPEDRKIILLCNTGTRSYEAQVALKHAGYSDVSNVDGGITAIKQSGVKV